jgi:alkylated DNA repair dioxygenase AlkB
MDLFSAGASLQAIPIADGELAMLVQLALPIENAEVLRRLIEETPWRQESIVVYGKRHLQPRLSAWYGKRPYTYSGITLEPLPLTPLLQLLHAAVEEATGRRYNSVLLNYYRDGADGMGMHSDDETELGLQPAIASLSFGATRTFTLRHKGDGRTVKCDLSDGSLLLMAGSLQKFWQHGINKTKKPTGARINLTFRNIA